MYGKLSESTYFTPEYYDAHYKSFAKSSRHMYESVLSKSLAQNSVLSGLKHRHHEQSKPCEPHEGRFSAFLFFLFFLTLSALILLSVLLGVIQNGMEEAEAKNNAKEERHRQVEEFARQYPQRKNLLPLLRKTFDTLDVCGTNYLTQGELVHAGGRRHAKQVKEFFIMLDCDHNGELEFIEFCKYALREAYRDEKIDASMPSQTPGAADEKNGELGHSYEAGSLL
jgi:hypothetical protein